MGSLPDGVGFNAAFPFIQIGLHHAPQQRAGSEATEWPGKYAEHALRAQRQRRQPMTMGCDVCHQSVGSDGYCSTAMTNIFGSPAHLMVNIVGKLII